MKLVFGMLKTHQPEIKFPLDLKFLGEPFENEYHRNLMKWNGSFVQANQSQLLKLIFKKRFSASKGLSKRN